MIPKLSVKKKWRPANEIIEDYDEYELCYLDLCDVFPDDIIGLSLWPPEKLIADEKMTRLYQSILQNGWKDEFPGDLDLYLLPTGKFVVSYGGNHRAVISNELSVPKIKANVDLLIPRSLLSEDVINHISILRKNEQQLNHAAKEISFFLNSKDIYRDQYPDKIKEFNQLCEQAKKSTNKVNEILKNEAYKLELIPKKLNLTRITIR
ncbi:hypothetical protein [Paenibacillus sp. LPE1-1-1.1]|uniref:hypothetical protein n=1 Tax=Paenibacillus sp. LPE1-1-1.1 TaxID=3135230 RepID=UPI0034295F06